jgi:WD40 repeat protein
VILICGVLKRIHFFSHKKKKEDDPILDTYFLPEQKGIVYITSGTDDSKVKRIPIIIGGNKKKTAATKKNNRSTLLTIQDTHFTSINQRLKTLILSRNDGQLQLFKAWNSESVFFKGKHSSRISAMNISNDNKFIVTADKNGIIALWNAKTLQKIVSMVQLKPQSTSHFIITNYGFFKGINPELVGLSRDPGSLHFNLKQRYNPGKVKSFINSQLFSTSSL